MKHYQKSPVDLENKLQVEILANKLKVEGKIEKYNIKRRLITIKDHKSDFQSKPNFRSINQSL